jgi:hypothetical protein
VSLEARRKSDEQMGDRYISTTPHLNVPKLSDFSASVSQYLLLSIKVHKKSENHSVPFLGTLPWLEVNKNFSPPRSKNAKNADWIKLVYGHERKQKKTSEIVTELADLDWTQRKMPSSEQMAFRYPVITRGS